MLCGRYTCAEKMHGDLNWERLKCDMRALALYHYCGQEARHYMGALLRESTLSPPLTDICGHNGLHCAAQRREPPQCLTASCSKTVQNTALLSAPVVLCFAVFHPYVSVVLSSTLVQL